MSQIYKQIILAAIHTVLQKLHRDNYFPLCPESPTNDYRSRSNVMLSLLTLVTHKNQIMYRSRCDKTKKQHTTALSTAAAP